MQKLVLFSISLVMLSHPIQAAEFSLHDANEHSFLIFRTEIESTKDIGVHAQKQIPKLFEIAKSEGIKPNGEIHHFYYTKGGQSFLEIGIPVESGANLGSSNKGAYRIVKKPPYRFLRYIHHGPISTIGQSWPKLHSQRIQQGEVGEGTVEVYLSGINDLMSKDTRVELREILLPKELIKGECVVVGFAPNSQASKAGMREGDIIRTYAGEPTANFADLIEAIKSHKDGKGKIEVVVLRGKAEETLMVKSGSLGAAIENQ